ncbi:PucR family transcriptional regulator [Actinocrinis sp.]|uniref:PucR family transcriptional regulator n=1 Tax=Actinocrinis sp. TaxID=1920516 RepID=UPI002D29C84F|nr:PucR family transcriptional regulator ligand-binding domain-containing protein [Actinocrinis sp.]HZP50818.1 PucR family transcriptional regulator ligand-binding domain-containing protein [Actinocrinis sp.]
MRLRDLVEASPPGLTPVTGAPGLDRELGSVMVTDLPDPSRYLRGGELVVSGLVWLADQRKSATEHCELFVGAIAKAGCAGLAAGDTTDAPLPRELLASCTRYGVPLLHVPAKLAFADLTEWISRRISAERAGDAGELLARHRRLVAAEAQQGMSGIVRLIAQETGMACGVITAAGELVAAHDGQQPSAAARAAIAREALRTAAQPERLVEYRGRAYSVYTVPGRPGTPVTDWYALFEGDWRAWPRQRRDAARSAARLIGAERARLAEGQRALRRVGRELVTLAAAAGPTAEIGARLTVAGLDPAAGLRAIAVAVTVANGAPGSNGGNGGAGAVSGGTVSGGVGGPQVGRLARVLVEAAEAQTPVPIAVFGPSAGSPPNEPDEEARRDARSARDDGASGDPWLGAAYAVALSADPLLLTPTASEGEAGTRGDAPSGPTGSGAPTAAATATTTASARAPSATAATLRARLTALSPGLGRSRVAVGLSDRFTQAADLAGAIEEARLALRLAMRRPGRLELTEHDELASHLVLLAHVPDELRRGYRDRLLGPLRAYDTRHHSQLEETLDRFLGCSASWSRCAHEMHIHVNTLRYRIEKINQLTGRDLARLDHQVDFYLALRAR